MNESYVRNAANSEQTFYRVEASHDGEHWHGINGDSGRFPKWKTGGENRIDFMAQYPTEKQAQDTVQAQLLWDNDMMGEVYHENYGVSKCYVTHYFYRIVEVTVIRRFVQEFMYPA